MTVSIHNVSKRTRTARGKTQLFDGLNIEIHEGDRIALLGSVGSGKSAALALMSGELEPDTGWVERHGFTSWPLPKVPSLSKDMTGMTNARFLARMYGQNEDEYIDRVRSLADVSRYLNDRLVYWPKLAKTELQIALGLCLNFDTYLFDGRPAAGSKPFIAAVEAELKALEPHKSVLVASSDAKLVSKYCNQAYVLYNKQAVHFPELEDGIAFFNAINDTKGAIKGEEVEDDDDERDDDDDAAAFAL